MGRRTGTRRRVATEASVGIMGMFAEDSTPTPPTNAAAPVPSIACRRRSSDDEKEDDINESSNLSELSNTLSSQKTSLEDDSTSASSQEEEEDDSESEDDSSSSNEEEESVTSEDSEDDSEEAILPRENKAVRVGDSTRTEKKRWSDTTATSRSNGSSGETEEDDDYDSEGEYLDDGEYNPEEEEEEESDSDSEESELLEVVNDPDDEVALMRQQNDSAEHNTQLDGSEHLCKTMAKLSIELPDDTYSTSTQEQEHMSDESFVSHEEEDTSDVETESEVEEDDNSLEESSVDQSPRKMMRKKLEYSNTTTRQQSTGSPPNIIHENTPSEDEGMMEIHTDDDDNMDILDDSPEKESDSVENNSINDDDDESCAEAEVVMDEDFEDSEEQRLEEEEEHSSTASATATAPKEDPKPLDTTTPVDTVHGTDRVASLYSDTDDTPQKSEQTPPLTSVKVLANDAPSILSFDDTCSDKENKSSGDFAKDDERISHVGIVKHEYAHKTPKPETKNQRTKKNRTKGIKPGKWSLGSKIGKGAFGVVHIGMNTESGRLMAVKSIGLERVGMKDLRREIDLLRSLEHENIVQYYGALQDKGNLLIFQEWVAGGSVTELLDKFGPFTLDVCRTYLYQTLTGLSYLHGNNIMHRDIKGSNILVSNDGVAKLADFGASRKISKMQSDLMMSLTMIGTPYFMAPEVFVEKYSSKADIWAVGCVAYQMVTGRPPWKELGFTSPVALFNHVQSRSKGPDYDLKNGSESQQLHFRALMDKCFALAPNERPTANALLEEGFFEDGPLFSDESFADQESLFSPSPSVHHMSPSPLSAAHMRRSSVGGQQSPFLSPPIPRSTKKRQSNHQSPTPDMSAWPSWAKNKYNESVGTPKEQSMKSCHKAGDSLVYSTGETSEISVRQGLASPLGHSRLANSKTSEQSGLEGLLYLSPTS